MKDRMRELEERAGINIGRRQRFVYLDDEICGEKLTKKERR